MGTEFSFWLVNPCFLFLMKTLQKMQKCKKKMTKKIGILKNLIVSVGIQPTTSWMDISCKAGSTWCVVRIRGASYVNVSKRFAKFDTYSLLWCVNLPPNWRTRCDEWTNDTSTQIRHIFSYRRCANHDTSRIQTTYCVDLA